MLLDDEAVLACVAHVDVSPIQANESTLEASIPEGSVTKGSNTKENQLCGDDPVRRRYKTRSRKTRDETRNSWLGSIRLKLPPIPDGGRGVVNVTPDVYRDLVNWTQDQMRLNATDHVPADIKTILKGIGLNAQKWCDLVRDFGIIFKRVAGTAEHIKAKADALGRHWLCAPGNPLGANS